MLAFYFFFLRIFVRPVLVHQLGYVRLIFHGTRSTVMVSLGCKCYLSRLIICDLHNNILNDSLKTVRGSPRMVSGMLVADLKNKVFRKRKGKKTINEFEKYSRGTVKTLGEDPVRC
jgi:hypothetical protein